GSHRLPFAEYTKARSLGVELPEAEPTFELGLLYGDDPYPVSVIKPVEFPLSGCYRYEPPEDQQDYESGAANVHLLSALGRFAEPFVPVVIREVYAGYSWARLRTITRAEVTVGRTLHEDDVWGGRIRCVDRIEIAAHTSDGRVISADVCMAVPLAGTGPGRCDQDCEVYVTPKACDELAESDIAHHLGGWSDDGDTIQTQEAQFGVQLDHFWAELKGPHERLRAQLVELVTNGAPDCIQVTVHKDGTITLHSADGSVVTVAPAV
ncbi:MAG: hypothetical protein ACKVP6_11020, partial [Mycobacterium sp.]